jgi:DNA-directed RNA polymerase specialized sigma24 family protein
MNENHISTWREVQFNQQQWENIPESAALWPNEALDQAAELRLQTEAEIALTMQAIMVTALTKRQRQVLELYYLEDRTQAEIANAMGISQATVSQHLKGKRRGKSRVGGAFRKIRKAIHKAAKRRKHPDGRYIQIVKTLDQLLDRSLTHRRARRLLDALADPDS